MRLFLLLPLLFPIVAYADGVKVPTVRSQATANYNKSEKLLPGEEVTTPGGKKIKVWTTSGPVPVSKAPEPFEDPQPRVGDIDVVIDGRSIPRDNPAGRGSRDTFDIRN